MCKANTAKFSQTRFHSSVDTKKSALKKKCSVEQCQAELHAHTTLASVDDIETFLEERVNEFTISNTSASIGLCKEHYARLYSYLHPSIPCESCSAKPKQWENFKRHCPSPNIVNGYLSHISNEKSTLTASSTICMSCYKYFQSIVQQLKQMVHTLLVYRHTTLTPLVRHSCSKSTFSN